MAMQLGELEVKLSADTSPLKKAEREVKKTSGKMESSFKRVGLAIAAAFSFDAIRRLTLATDALQVMERRLQRFTGSSASAEKTFKKLVSTASAVGSEIKTVASIFERFSLIREDIGATNEQIITMTDTLAKLGAIGGSSGEEIGRALTQLSQGLAGGVLRAEEFNSIIEQAPEIAKAIGEQMGLSLGEMRKEMLAGKLTSDKVFKAILDSTEKTNKQFREMPKSIALAAQALENNLLVAVGKLNTAAGFTNSLANLINQMAEGAKFLSNEMSRQEKMEIQLRLAQEERAETIKDIIALQEMEISTRSGQQSRDTRVLQLQKEVQQTDILIDRIKFLFDFQKNSEELQAKRQRENAAKKAADSPVKITPEELEALAAKLELRFAMTQEANLQMEAEELRFRAAILSTTKLGSEDRMKAEAALNVWRASEWKRVDDEEVEAARQTEQDKQQLRLDGLNALSGLIGQASGIIQQGMEEGNAAAKAAFVAMKAIQVSQIIASTEVAANAAGATTAASGGGFFGYLATSGGISAVGYASAGLVAGLSIGGGRRHGGQSSPNLATPINEAGVPEILEQSGKQFLLPTGKAGKVSPMTQGTSGGQPNVNIINNGVPFEVDSMSVSREEITMMVSNGVKQGQKEMNQSFASGRGLPAQSIQKGFRVERKL